MCVSVLKPEQLRFFRVGRKGFNQLYLFYVRRGGAYWNGLGLARKSSAYFVKK